MVFLTVSKFWRKRCSQAWGNERNCCQNADCDRRTSTWIQAWILNLFAVMSVKYPDWTVCTRLKYESLLKQPILTFGALCSTLKMFWEESMTAVLSKETERESVHDQFSDGDSVFILRSKEDRPFRVYYNSFFLRNFTRINAGGVIFWDFWIKTFTV